MLSNNCECSLHRPTIVPHVPPTNQRGGPLAVSVGSGAPDCNAAWETEAAKVLIILRRIFGVGDPDQWWANINRERGVHCKRRQLYIKCNGGRRVEENESPSLTVVAAFLKLD